VCLLTNHFDPAEQASHHLEDPAAAAAERKHSKNELNNEENNSLCMYNASVHGEHQCTGYCRVSIDWMAIDRQLSGQLVRQPAQCLGRRGRDAQQIGGAVETRGGAAAYLAFCTLPACAVLSLWLFRSLALSCFPCPPKNSAWLACACSRYAKCVQSI
jgi:hypothetical protein